MADSFPIQFLAVVQELSGNFLFVLGYDKDFFLDLLVDYNRYTDKVPSDVHSNTLGCRG